MGADNLSQINLWINWNKIFDIIPIAVFNREGYSRTVISSVAANYYNQSLYNKQNLSKIFKRELPVWVFIRLRKLPYSSTEIRYNRKRNN
jgi:nicotinate-nucleotide adenylyltransferase